MHRPSDKGVSTPVHTHQLFILLAAFIKHTALNGFDPNRNESLGQLLNEESVACPLLRDTCTVERRGWSFEMDDEVHQLGLLFPP